MSEISGNPRRRDAPPGFVWNDDAEAPSLSCSTLSSLATHLFTTRRLEFRGDRIERDYGSLAAQLNVNVDQVVRVRQVHGRAVSVVRSGDTVSHPIHADADAIVVTAPGKVASVRTADCVPILIADRAHRVVAAIHAGWRGTAAGVAAAAIQAIRDGGVDAADLVAAIGPSVGPCCYQVDRPVREAFDATQPGSAHSFVPDGDGRWKLDLWRANAEQLIEAGVPAGAIEVARLCTADQLDTFYSHRREGAGAGRMVAAIRLTPG